MARRPGSKAEGPNGSSSSGGESQHRDEKRSRILSMKTVPNVRESDAVLLIFRR